MCFLVFGIPIPGFISSTTRSWAWALRFKPGAFLVSSWALGLALFAAPLLPRRRRRLLLLLLLLLRWLLLRWLLLRWLLLLLHLL